MWEGGEETRMVHIQATKNEQKLRLALSSQTHQLPLPSFPQLHFELCHPLSIHGTAHSSPRCSSAEWPASGSTESFPDLPEALPRGAREREEKGKALFLFPDMKYLLSSHTKPTDHSNGLKGHQKETTAQQKLATRPPEQRPEITVIFNMTTDYHIPHTRQSVCHCASLAWKQNQGGSQSQGSFFIESLIHFMQLWLLKGGGGWGAELIVEIFQDSWYLYWGHWKPLGRSKLSRISAKEQQKCSLFSNYWQMKIEGKNPQR